MWGRDAANEEGQVKKRRGPAEGEPLLLWYVRSRSDHGVMQAYALVSVLGQNTSSPSSNLASARAQTE